MARLGVLLLAFLGFSLQNSVTAEVIPKKLAILVEGRPDLELDLTQDVSNVKLKIKQGSEYKIRIDFVIEGKGVQGLRYIQKTLRAGIKVDKTEDIIGDLSPVDELQSYTSPASEAPTGIVARSGVFNVVSEFRDNDGLVDVKWNWKYQITKDW